MAKPLRIPLAGGIYHLIVIARGNDRAQKAMSAEMFIARPDPETPGPGRIPTGGH